MTECEMSSEWTVSNFEALSRYVIWALAMMGIIKEVECLNIYNWNLI